MTMHAPSSYEFWPFRLSVRERKLFRHEMAVPLQPMGFDVLSVLVQNAGRLLTKDELLRALWPDKDVEEGNISVHVHHVRKALDAGDRHRYITNLPGRGYQFVAEVTEILDAPKADSRAIEKVSAYLAGSDGRSEVALAPEEIVQTVVNLYLTKGYTSCGLELCRHSLSISPAEQERMLAQMKVPQAWST